MTTVRMILGHKGNDVITADTAMSLAEVADRLSAYRVGALVVVDGALRVTGIISERDVVRAIATHGVGALSEEAGRFMTRTVVTCTHADTVDELMDVMTEGRFRHVPVVEDGRLAGIVSIGDVVKHRIAAIEREAAEIRAYIATA